MIELVLFSILAQAPVPLLISTTVPTNPCNARMSPVINPTTGAFYTCIAGVVTNISGTAPGSTVPSGSILLITSGSCAAGYAEAVDLDGLTVVGTLVAHGDVGTTGGSDNITPTGTNSAPVFTGNSVVSSAVSAGTPSGSNSAPALTMNSYTPTGTNGTASFTPVGTNSVPVFTGTVGQSTSSNSAGTPSGINSVPTLTMNSYTPTGTNTAPSFTGAAGTVPAETVSWPTNTPTVGPDEFFEDLSAWGSLGAGVAHRHELAWPTDVPTNSTVSFTPSGTVAAPNFTGTSAILTGSVTASVFTGDALGTHSHTFTATGTVGAPTFTGTPGTVPAETFTGNAAVLTGSVAAPVFTGNALGTHTHITTATGANTTPTFTGNSFDNRSAFIKAIFCRKL